MHALINDFHEWTAWSPWEGLDPDLQRTYSGPDAGVGAHYAWQGNRKAGEGTMEITGSAPDRIDDRAARSSSRSASTPTRWRSTSPRPAAAPTSTWRMTGEHERADGR